MKRVLLGVLIAVGMLVAGMWGSLFVASPAAQGAGASGRYEIVFSPHARQDKYLLDTQTGRIWQPISYTDLEGDPVVWEYQERVNSRAELLKWADGRPRKKTTSRR